MRHANEDTIDGETLRCIAGFQKEFGFSPSYTQIAECLGLKGKSSVHRRMERLKKAGLIRVHARSRAIEIVKHRKGKCDGVL